MPTNPENSHTRTVPSSAEAETVLLSKPVRAMPPAPAAASPAPHSHRAVEFVRGGSATGLATESQGLLHTRLRAVLLILLIGFSLFFVRNLFLDTDEHHKHFLMWLLHAGIIFMLASFYAWLRRVPVVGIRRLRQIELATFGTIIAFFAAVQVLGMIDSCRLREPVNAVALMKNVTSETFMLIVLYGLFVPNTWQRAARMVIPMALVPPLTSTLVHLTHPELRSFMREVANVERVTDNLLFLVMGAIIAIYGSHVLNSLRRAVREARQLGQYHLRRLLGRGGMGEVYLAEHCLLKRPCAIKLIKPEAAGHPEALARFEREVNASAELTHPNTIEIYDFGRDDDGTFYYVMEFLKGLSLSELVDRHGPLPAGRVIYLLRQACDALTEAHIAGLIHRDLKPGNLFAAQRGGLFDFIKILDFGLVKPMNEERDDLELSRDGMVKGSPLYMSPEQALGQGDLDGRSDIYALGAVGYFLLTGHPPFDGTSAVEVMVAHARDPVKPPSELRPDIPRDLESVLMRCMSKKPIERYPTTEALGQALAACQDAASWNARAAADWWKRHHPAGGNTDATEAAADPVPHPAT